MTDNNISILNDENTETDEVSSDNVNSIDTNVSSDSSTSSQILLDKTTIHNASTSEYENLHQWPYPFVLRDDVIRPSTLRKLNHGMKLEPSDESSLFLSVFEECIQYTL